MRLETLILVLAVLVVALAIVGGWSVISDLLREPRDEPGGEE